MENTISKRKTYSNTEKALLLEAYKASGIVKKQWCKENAVGLSTLERWLMQEKKHQPQPRQNWVSLMATAPEVFEGLDIQIGKCKIAVNTKTDKTLLTEVLGVLMQVC
jgi:transposase-like protein